jgi:hypothetical protein
VMSTRCRSQPRRTGPPTGWEVNVMLLRKTSPGGYSSTTIWTYTAAYDEPGRAGPDEVSRVTKANTHPFAFRFKEVLA